MRDPKADAADEDLLRAGSEAAMTTLIRRYEQPIFRFLRAWTRDVHLAEDLFQETFLRLHRSRRSFREGSPLKPYLYRIALNLARDAHAWSRARPSPASLDEPATAREPRDGTPGPDEEAGGREEADRIRRAVEGLPESEREVVILRVFDGLSFPEIAGIAGVPVPTAKSRMIYALRRLRPALEAGLGRGGKP